MEKNDVVIAKRIFGAMYHLEREEVLGRFDSIPEQIKHQLLDTLSKKERALKEDNPHILYWEDQLATWAENNLGFLDEYLIQIDFDLFGKASLRAIEVA